VSAVSFVRVIDAEKRDRSAKNLHWRSVSWHASEQVDDFWIQFARCGEMVGKLSKFGGGRESSEPEEIGSFLEGRELCEFVDIDSAIGENSGVSVDPTDGRRGGNDAFQAFRCDSGRHKALLQERS
jgi:hypothetical protein